MSVCSITRRYTAQVPKWRVSWRYVRCVYTSHMSAPRFEWNPQKALQNLKKHGIVFSEAQTVFEDDDALLIPDPEIIRATRTATSCSG